MPLSVGRTASVAAVESALATEDKEIIVVAQRDASVETPGAADLYTIGTRAVIRKSGRPKARPHRHLVVQGIERVVIVKVERERPPEGARSSAAAARRFQPRDRSADALDRRDGHPSSSA